MESRMNVSMQSYFGIVLTLLGVGFILDTIGVYNFREVLSFWWPTLLVILAILGLFSTADKSWAIILLIVGVALQLQEFGYVRFNIWNLIWPTILIMVGINLIRHTRKSTEGYSENEIDEFVAFGGSEKRIVAENFSSGNITAIFGGVKVDLENTKFANNAEMNIMAMFGGVEIIVPRDVKVITKGTSLLGGWSNNSRPDDKPKYTLILKGNAMFGGIEVKN